MSDASNSPETPAEIASTEPSPAQTNRYYVVLFQSGFPHDLRGDFSRFSFPEIQAKLDANIRSKRDETEIDVWLESPGGDAHVAYKLFLELQNRCRKLRAVIPDYAKSAATLFVLGADEIFMAPSAELGPLDAQIEHPDREGVTISALEMSKTLGFLGNFAVDYVINGGQAILRSTELPRVDVLREFSRFSAAFLRPIVAKLDPILVYRAGNQLDLAHKYARTMLSLRRLSPEDEGRKGDAKDLVTHIVEHYPVHGFVISRKEASELPLPVKDAELYDRWKEIRLLHALYHDGVFSTQSSDSMIEVWNESDLEQIVELFGEDDDEVEAVPEGVTNGNNDQEGGGQDQPAND